MVSSDVEVDCSNSGLIYVWVMKFGIVFYIFINIVNDTFEMYSEMFRDAVKTLK